MDRAELERLDRDALIEQASKAGIAKPSILTRPELVDELLVRGAPRPDDPTLRKVRGFFGLARDLLASVIDRGLHLPDAAERIRSLRGPLPPPPVRMSPNVLPTVTLAEIYATQGHRDRAVDTLRKVLEGEPDHAVARALLAQLEDASYAAPKPPHPPEEEEESSPHEELEEPLKFDLDECIAIPVGLTSLFVCWEVRDATFGHAGRTKPGGALVLRVLVVVPAWEGPSSSVRDIEVEAMVGDWLVRDLPPGAVVRVAIGWRTRDAFRSFAHSPALEAPSGDLGPSLAVALVRRTPQGAVPISAADRDAESIQRAMRRVDAGTRHVRDGVSASV